MTMAYPTPNILKLGRAVEKFFSYPSAVRDKMIAEKKLFIIGGYVAIFGVAALPEPDLEELALMKVLLELAMNEFYKQKRLRGKISNEKCKRLKDLTKEEFLKGCGY